MKPIIIFDMYGVIIKESKGNFIPYVYTHFPNTDRSLIRFSATQKGEITADEFITALGFTDSEAVTRDYIENYLTFNSDFITFAEKFKDKYDYILLSNDVLEWSKYITSHYDLDKYFTHKIVSGDVGFRKPDKEMFELAVSKRDTDYIFIDNSVRNLSAAAEFGIRPILFNCDNEVYDGETVYSFAELERIIS